MENILQMPMARAYRHIRTELTKNWFHTFLLSTFIFI